MLLRWIKDSAFFGVLLIPIAGVLFWMQSFQMPHNLEAVTKNEVMPLYSVLLGLLKGLPFWQIVIGFLLVIVNSCIIERLSSTFLLFKKGAALPGLIYVLTISSLKILQTIHPVHIATLCILIAIYYIFDTYRKRLEVTFTFNASFFIALASLFYLPSAALFPLIWISIFVLQKSDNWRLMLVPFLGFSVPWLFSWSIAFMNDTNVKFISTIKNIMWADNNAYLLEPVFLSVSVVIILLTILGSISFLSGYHLMKVSARKYFTIFSWMFGLLVITALSFTTIGIEIIALSTIPTAFMISLFFLSGERSVWRELIFLFFIGVLATAYLI